MTYEEGIDIDAEVKAIPSEDGEAKGAEAQALKEEDKPDSAVPLESRLADGKDEAALQKPDGDVGVGEESEVKDSEGLKRKALDRSQSSFIEDSAATKKAKDVEEVSHGTQVPSLCHTTDEQPVVPTPPAGSSGAGSAAAPPAKKPQASFASFSSKPSPFAASTSSPFASAGASSPSPFASAGASGSAPAPSIFTKSGFGNYSSSFSPFAKSSPKPNEPKENEEAESKTKESATDKSSFGDILKADTGAEEGDEADRVQMTEQDGELRSN
jgi:hypothetical protein